MAKTFSETRTEDFVDFFYSNQRLPDSYFDQWVKMIAGEIQIAYENKEAQELWKLENRMKNNCAHCNEEQIEIVKKFANKIRKHFP